MHGAKTMAFTEQQWADILAEDERDGPGWVFAVGTDRGITVVPVSSRSLDGTIRDHKEAEAIAIEKARRSYRKEFGAEIRDNVVVQTR